MRKTGERRGRSKGENGVRREKGKEPEIIVKRKEEE